MAIAAIDELWFSNPVSSSSPQKSKSSRSKASTDVDEDMAGAGAARDQSDLVAQSIILMNVAGSFRERPSPLEDALRLVRCPVL
jgi:hypothetical protein